MTCSDLTGGCQRTVPTAHPEFVRCVTCGRLHETAGAWGPSDDEDES